MGARDPIECDILWRACPPPDAGADAAADAEPDAEADASAYGCNGQCLPVPPIGWSQPVLLAFGDESTVPSCPAVAPVVGYEGHAGLNAPAAVCGPCSCGASEGSCGLPGDLTASTLGVCPNDDPGAWTMAWDAPAGWDGACTAADPITCGNGNNLCAHSVMAAPLTIDDSCAPLGPPAATVAPYGWSTFARACAGSAGGACESLGETCASASAEGFQVCIFQEGDVDCPSLGPYTDKLVFYGGAEDTRGCSGCTCGKVEGSSCAAVLHMYSDDACTVPAGAVSVGSSASAVACVTLPGNVTLGSKVAHAISYVPGGCEPGGGEPAGEASGAPAATFCCLVG